MMRIEKLTVRDLQEVLKLLPSGKYDSCTIDLINDIKAEGFTYKVVNEDGTLLAGFISTYGGYGEGYICEVFNNKTYKGKRATSMLVKKFNDDTRGVKHYFEIYPGSYLSSRLYKTYFKSIYIDMKLYTGNLNE